jgi:DNA-binding CsgD family transcriptional regulator
MGSRHVEESSTALQAIQPSSSRVAGAPDDSPDFTMLLAVAERLLGMRDDVGNRICEEVDALTRHRALLRLHPPEGTRRIRSEAAAGARLYPVRFAGHFYGTLAVAPDPQDSPALVLPDSLARKLAYVCAVVLCLLEQAALLDVLSQHVTPEPLKSLTPRQQEVLALITQGLSDDEIVEALHITPSTLERHQCDIRARLGVHATHDLLLAAYHYGLVSYIVPGM